MHRIGPRTRPSGWRRAAAMAAVAGMVTTGVVTLSGTAGAAKHKKSKSPIYFGAVLGLTNTFAAIEQPNLQGLEAGVTLINKHGGVLGHPVKLEYVDDQSKPTKVIPALQTLLGKGKMAFVEAEVIPNFQETMLPYLNQDKIISIEPTSGPTIFTAVKNPYNFEAYPSTGQAQASVAAVKELGGATPKLAVITTGNSADVALAKEIETGTTKLGGQVVYKGSIAPTATTATPQVELAQHAGANVIVSQTGSNGCKAVADAIGTLGWKTVQGLATPACISTTTMEAVPATVASRWQAIGERTYLRGSSGVPADLKSLIPAIEKYGQLSDLFISTATAYVVNLMAFAINKAKSTTSTKVLHVLQDIGNLKVPASDLFGLPNPGWAPTVHTYANADLSTFWALLSPGTPVTGQFTGKALSVPKTTPT